MRKSVKLFITGAVQNIFFEIFIKGNAEKNKVKGFLRKREDGRMELFIEGKPEDVDKMISIAKRGSRHSQIRNVEEHPERFQDFKEFKILKI